MSSNKMSSNKMSTIAYIAQLTPQEQKVLKIAMEHLETSFNIVKSIGYQKWLKTNTTGTSTGTGTGTDTSKLTMKPLLSKL